MQVKYHQYSQGNTNILFCSVLPCMGKMDLVCLEATFSFCAIASYRWLFLVQSFANAALLFLLSFQSTQFLFLQYLTSYLTLLLLSTFCSFSPQGKKKDFDISLYQCEISTLYYHKISLVLFVFCDIILLNQIKLVQWKLSPSGPKIFFHHHPGNGLCGASKARSI